MLKEEYVVVKKQVDSWQEAIEIASLPLVRDGVITSNYVKKMIANVIELGPYIVISNDVAIPHAKAEDGVHQAGMSILKLQEKVLFDKQLNKGATVILVLATTCGEDHLKLLKKISIFLSNPRRYALLLQCDDPTEIYNLWSEEER